jgi:hypothetical protein
MPAVADETGREVLTPSRRNGYYQSNNRRISVKRRADLIDGGRPEASRSGTPEPVSEARRIHGPRRRQMLSRAPS